MTLDALNRLKYTLIDSYSENEHETLLAHLICEYVYYKYLPSDNSLSFQDGVINFNLISGKCTFLADGNYVPATIDAVRAEQARLINERL